MRTEVLVTSRMRKQELVYVHGLLAELRGFYEAQTGERIDAPEYDALEVRPTSIHMSKPDHEIAVFTLAAAMAAEMGAAPRAAQLD
jgi:hypothetical protein